MITSSKHETLTPLPERLAVCRLGPGEAIPAWATRGPFLSITRTAEELSVVCLESDVPSGVQAQLGWRAIKVLGPLDFALTGVLARLTTPLAEAGISIFAVSTYDTDYILVQEGRLTEAAASLRAAGYSVLQRE